MTCLMCVSVSKQTRLLWRWPQMTTTPKERWFSASRYESTTRPGNWLHWWGLMLRNLAGNFTFAQWGKDAAIGVTQLYSAPQGCAAEHFRWGAPGGHHGLGRCGSSVPDEAPRPGSDTDQAALLDSDALQQVCVHGCRHHGEKTQSKYSCLTLWKVRILLTEWMLITFIWKCPGSIKHRWALWEGGAVCRTRPGLARLLQLGGFCLQTI